VRSRPPTGLLGGMTEVPKNEWSHDFDVSNALREAPLLPRATPQWLRQPGVVTHVFTHFPLELTVYTAEVGAKTSTPAGMRWVALADLPGEALPNGMRKVLAHARALSG
jgi:A/G-specific adenine glycosylase